MPNVSACPSPRILQRFLLAQLPDQEAESIEQHLLQCTACCGTASGLKAEDALVEGMRWAQAHPAETTETGVLESLVSQLSGLRPSITPPPSEVTIAANDTANPMVRGGVNVIVDEAEGKD
jgi:hypothetical protein